MAGNHQGQGVATVVVQEVIEIVAELISVGMKKHAIKRWIEEHIFGSKKISIKSYEVIRTRAKKLLAENADITSEEHKSYSIDFYRQVVSNQNLPAQSRIRAMENLDDIFGIKDKDNEDADPMKRAKKIREILSEADSSVGEGDEIEFNVN